MSARQSKVCYAGQPMKNTLRSPIDVIRPVLLRLGCSIMNEESSSIITGPKPLPSSRTQHAAAQGTAPSKVKTETQEKEKKLNKHEPNAC
jgi:hypothetical protein